MNVLFLLTKNRPPSSRLRITNCLKTWEKKGINCTVLPIPSGIKGRYQILKLAKANDLIVIQKKTSFRSFELKLLHKTNPNILFDFDDAVMFHELEHHKPLKGKYFTKFIRTINHCSTVVAGNNFLASFAKKNCTNVHILPTPVDIRNKPLKDWHQPSDKIILGWLGVSGNLHYLKELAPVLKQLTINFPNLFLKIVSNDFIEIEGVNIIKTKWSLEEEAHFLTTFDIGLMPLKDDIWSQGKCGYKILQYFGAGIPAVASPVGINTEFVINGVTGYLASSLQEWEAALTQLISNKQHRIDCGMNGYKRIQEKYSQEIYEEKYFEIMTSSCKYLK